MTHTPATQSDAVPSSEAVRKRIVVGVDGSYESRIALSKAAELALQMGATLEPVAAWQYPPLPEVSILSDWSPERDARQLVHECLAEEFRGEIPDWVRPIVSAGPPAHALVECSRGADLLVVGSRGHGGFVGLLLGSVSSACAAYAHCPVLIMRETEAPSQA